MLMVTSKFASIRQSSRSDENYSMFVVLVKTIQYVDGVSPGAFIPSKPLLARSPQEDLQ